MQRATHLLVAESSDYLQRCLDGARADNRQDLDHLLECCMPAIHDLATAVWANKHRAGDSYLDLEQETMLRALRNFSQFHGRSLAEFLAWLRIFLHLLSDYGLCRRRRPTSLSEIAEPASEGKTPSDLAMKSESEQAIQNIIRDMDAETRQILNWFLYDKLSSAEIGRRLGRSAEAVRKVRTRALHSLYPWIENADLETKKTTKTCDQKPESCRNHGDN
jgi:RNA polymerase sigma-70 factor, ECF subfamily